MMKVFSYRLKGKEDFIPFTKYLMIGMLMDIENNLTTFPSRLCKMQRKVFFSLIRHFLCFIIPYLFPKKTGIRFLETNLRRGWLDHLHQSRFLRD
jgi:hypothetical protein